MFCVHTWEVFVFMQHSSCNYFTMIEQPVACTNSSAAKNVGVLLVIKAGKTKERRHSTLDLFAPDFSFFLSFFNSSFLPSSFFGCSTETFLHGNCCFESAYLWQCSVTAERMQKDPEYAGALYPNSEMLQMRWMFSSLSSIWRGFATTRRFCFIAARGGSWARACLAPSTSL